MNEVAPGQRFGAYRLQSKLGEGGMGPVWAAIHEGLDKRVALKTLSAGAHTQEQVARFVREGKAAARIHHPHVISVTDVGVHEGVAYLVMEHLEGETLGEMLARVRRLDVQTVTDLAIPVLDGLAAAHAAGIIHRDLKPDNIFLKRARTGELHPVVLDFGISKVEGGDAALTKTHAFMGTPYYMSPEQARGARDVDWRADQFSLGLLIYEALSGRRAVDGDSVLEIVHKLSSGDITPLHVLRPDLPAQVVHTVARMMSLRAEDRFASLSQAASSFYPFASARTQAVWASALAAGGAAIPVVVAPTQPMPEATGARPLSTLGAAAGEYVVPPRSASLLSPGVLALAAGGALLACVAVAAALSLSFVGGGEAVATPPGALAAAPPAAELGAPAPALTDPASTGSLPTGSLPTGSLPTEAAPQSAALIDAPGDVAEEDHAVSAARAAHDRPESSHPSRAHRAAPAVVAAEPEDERRPVFRPVEAPATTPQVVVPVDLPEQPSRSEVAAAMRGVMPVVTACGAGEAGTATVAITVAGDTGHVSSAVVSGVFAGTPVGACVSRAVMGARFPRFQRPTFVFSYPVRISGAAIIR